MQAFRAQLDDLGAAYQRLLVQVDGLLEENGGLKRELRAAGLPDTYDVEWRAEVSGSASASHESGDEKTVAAAQSSASGVGEGMTRAETLTMTRRQPASFHDVPMARHRGDDLPVARHRSSSFHDLPMARRQSSSFHDLPVVRRQSSCFREIPMTRRDSSLIGEHPPELRDVWEDEPETLAPADQVESSRAMADSDRGAKSSKHIKISTDAMLQGDKAVDESFLQRFVVTPSDRKRAVWDLITIFALAYDLLLLPLVVFGEPDHMVFFVANITTASVWLTDIVASCFLGYYVKGRLEMRPQKIILHYMKRWFFLDLTVSLLDIMELVALGAQVDLFSALRLGKLSRFGRMLRLLRLMRLSKVMETIRRRTEMIKLDGVRTVMKVVELLSAIVLCNHFVACAWYGIGTWDLLPPEWPTWVKQLNLNDAPSPDRAEFYFYATALHWSFTQCTPASMEVVPRNSLERCYTIMVLFLGLVMFSSLISSVTGAMTQFRERSRERSKQREILTKYLRSHRVSLGLGNQVFEFLQHKGFSTSKRLIDSDVPGLSKLPEKLRKKLHCEVYGPVLRAHLLFLHLDKLQSDAMMTICHMAMSQALVLDGHRLFHFKEEATKMYFVTDGSMVYFEGLSEVAKALVRVRDYVSEACLWVTWWHRGRLVADKDTEVAMLDPQAFSGIARNTDAFLHCRTYAQTFYLRLIAMNSHRVNDMPFAADHLQDMMREVFEDFSVSKAAATAGSGSSDIMGYLRRATSL